MCLPGLGSAGLVCVSDVCILARFPFAAMMHKIVDADGEEGLSPAATREAGCQNIPN